jgi:hypothetical protein
MAEAASWQRFRVWSGTYDVGADLLAGDLVVDDHLEGVGWERSWRSKAMWKRNPQARSEDEVNSKTAFPDKVSVDSR